MAILLKQSTAKVISFGPFVDKTDGVTPETGLVSALDHASTGIMLSKNGGAFAIRNATVTASTYDAYGNYRVTLDTTDTGTLGTLRMQFIETATCLPVWMDFMVLPATVYDALVTNAVNATGGLTGATGAITGLAGVIATTTNITAGTLTTVTTATNVTTVNGLAAGVITAASIAADAITAAKIADGAIDAATFAAGAINAAAIAADAITDAKVASDVTIASVTGAVGSVTGNVGGNVTGTIGGFTTAAKAEIQTEAEDALVVHRLDELLNADSDIDGAAPPTVGSVFHELMTKTAGSFTYDQTTDSLEALRDRGDAAWTTATGFSTHTAADVWAVATRLLTAGTNIDGSTFTAIPWNAAWDAEVQSEVDDALVAQNLDHLVKIAVDTDFATTVHLNSVIGHLADNGTTATFDRTTDSLESLQGAIDTIDNFIDTEVAAILAAVDTEVAAILADTNELQTDWTNGGRLDLILDAVLEDTAEIGVAGASLTNINLPNQTMDIIGNITGNLSGSVGSVTGNVGGNVTGSVGSVATGGISAASIADGAIDRATFAADTGLVTIRSNTAQAGASTTITLDASASSVTDFYKNALIVITGGTGIGQGRYCTAYNGTTKVATVTAWATNPDATSTFAIIAADAIVGATAPTASQVADEVQTRTIAAVTLVNGLAANTITAASIATGAIDADALAADAGTEIATAVWASATRTLTSLSGLTVDTVTTLTNLPAITTNWLTAAGTAADFGAEIATAIWTDTTASDFTTALSIGKSIMNGVALGTGLTINAYTGNTVQTGDAYAIVNSGTHGNAAIKGYVDDIGTAGAGLTAIPWNAAWDAEVQSEVDDALVAQNLDHLVKIAVDTDFATTVHLNSVIGQLADNGTTATFDRTTDSLEALRDNTGTAGAGLTAADDATLAAIAALNNISTAQVNAEVDTALADVGLTTTITGRIDAAISSRMATYTQPTGFLAATFPTTVASTTNITAGTLTTVTTATNVTNVNDKTGYSLINVDGVAFADYMESLLAVLFGQAAPSGSTVAFKKRDGTTTKVSVTYGATDGQRTGSSIS